MEERGASVLVVEDDSGIRTLLATVARREGHVVDSANDGQQALESIQSRDYDAIVLDLMLPKVNGMEIIACLRVTNASLLKRTNRDHCVSSCTERHR